MRGQKRLSDGDGLDYRIIFICDQIKELMRRYRVTDSPFPVFGRVIMDLVLGAPTSRIVHVLRMRYRSLLELES